jgi:dihydrofolate reductase
MPQHARLALLACVGVPTRPGEYVKKRYDAGYSGRVGDWRGRGRTLRRADPLFARPQSDHPAGWWAPNPPYHTPVFVLTHHPRPSIAMEGGTTFHFVTDGIHAALQRATDASNCQDIRLGGGVATIRQYLLAGLVDEMRVGISPVLLGSGEHLLNSIDTLALGYQCAERVTTANATHFILTKRA